MLLVADRVTWVTNCLPPADIESIGEKGGGSGRSFIFVEFNAWEYVGSDVLWAALITKIFDKVEGHPAFGAGVVRAARVREALRDPSWNWNGLLTLYAVATVVGIITVVVFNESEAWNKAINNVWRWVLVVVGIPGVLTLLAFLLQMRSKGRLGTAQSALRRAATNQKSIGERYQGFMSEVKNELKVLFDVINSYNRQVPNDVDTLALIITVDDLDRCPSEKIMEMLTATHLLLQQPNAPMLVFIAVDPQLIVSAIVDSAQGIENKMKALQFLDKIIHIPFCLPRTSTGDRLKYMRSLLRDNLEDRGDPAGKNDDAEDGGDPDRKNDDAEDGGDPDGKKDDAEDGGDPDRKNDDPEDGGNPDGKNDDPEDGEDPDGKNDDPEGGGDPDGKNDEPSRKSLAVSPREEKAFADMFAIVQATPRKIKRVLNLFFLLRSVALASSNTETASWVRLRSETLVKWTMLAEFWPFRVSCILCTILKRYPDGNLPNSEKRRTIASAYKDSTRTSVSVEAWIRDRRPKEEMSDWYSLDETEGEFSQAMEAGETLDQGQVMSFFLQHSFNLNPAIASEVKVAMDDLKIGPYINAETETEEKELE